MSDKKINPYERLKRNLREWASEIVCPHRRFMWKYPKENLRNGFRLDDLWERIAAAKQLGYEVVVEAADDGIHVFYVKARPSDVPFVLRW